MPQPIARHCLHLACSCTLTPTAADRDAFAISACHSPRPNAPPCPTWRWPAWMPPSPHRPPAPMSATSHLTRCTACNPPRTRHGCVAPTVTHGDDRHPCIEDATACYSAWTLPINTGNRAEENIIRKSLIIEYNII
ncbi:hypothetical protein ACLOJK_006442 [Asimina triloba]